MIKNYLDFLACPVCYNQLYQKEEQLICFGSPDHTYYLEDGVPNLLPRQLSSDLTLSQSKWGEFYQEKRDSRSVSQIVDEYRRTFFPYVYRQINQVRPIKDSVFLEIGCGTFSLGQLIAPECRLVIGVDFSPLSLKLARQSLEERGIENYLLVLGDITQMPLRSNVADILYGGGVMEHFRQTQKAVNEFYRVLKTGGVSFNAVPYLNLGALTYRQIYGNIPNLPLIKQLAEFIHIKLLKSRHMIFGYELSFTTGQLVDLHRRAGFKNIKVEKFETMLIFEWVPFSFLKKVCVLVANNVRLFWPMVKVTAVK